MAVNAYARDATDRVVVPLGQLLAQAGVTANVLTLVGLLGTFGGLVLILLGYPVTGALVAGVASVLDALDGTVARVTGTQSQIGAFYDSVADRISDAAIFGAAAWLVRDNPRAFTVLMVAFATAMITSYIRAKAEALGWEASVGAVERPERVTLMLVALGLGYIEVAAWILAVGGVLTVVQRLVAVLRQARAEA